MRNRLRSDRSAQSIRPATRSRNQRCNPGRAGGRSGQRACNRGRWTTCASRRTRASSPRIRAIRRQCSNAARPGSPAASAAAAASPERCLLSMAQAIPPPVAGSMPPTASTAGDTAPRPATLRTGSGAGPKTAVTAAAAPPAPPQAPPRRTCRCPYSAAASRAGPRESRVSWPLAGWRGTSAASATDRQDRQAASANTPPGATTHRYPSAAGRKTAAM